MIAQLQDKLSEKSTQLSASQAESLKYRGLYEQYQGQVARLEAQIETASGQGHVLPRYDLVEEKAVQPLVLEMRLRLQAKGCERPQDLLFPTYNGESDVSIKQLKAALETSFGLRDQKALQLSRYLIEAREGSARPSKYSEQLTSTQAKVAKGL